MALTATEGLRRVVHLVMSPGTTLTAACGRLLGKSAQSTSVLRGVTCERCLATETERLDPGNEDGE